MPPKIDEIRKGGDGLASSVGWRMLGLAHGGRVRGIARGFVAEAC